MKRVEHDEAAFVVGAHFRKVDERRNFFRWVRAAMQNKFWLDGNNPWQTFAGIAPVTPGVSSQDTEFPIRMEVNWIRPYLSSFTSNLFIRDPKSGVAAPRVRLSTGKAGRPKKLQPDAVASYVDDWLTRSDVQDVSKHAYRLALLYDAAAFKLGWDSDGTDVVSRCWINAIPRWQCGWDERAANAREQAYCFHVRWERADMAEDIVKAGLPEGYQKSAIPDFLVDGTSQPDETTHQSAKVYVQLVEFYDLIAKEQRFYLLDGSSNTQNVAMPPWGEVGAIPYTRPDGKPAIPLVPIVLSPVADFPMQGMSAMEPIYSLNAEHNLLVTIVANAMRRDAARVLLYLKGRGIDQPVLDQIASGRDMALVGVDAATLEGTVQFLQIPKIAESIDKYRAWLGEDRQTAQGSSDIAQGKQGKYLSATEAQLLASAGESTASEIAETMQEALGRAAELMLIITGAHVGGDVIVDHGSDSFTLTAAELTDVQWTIEVQDATTTPVKESTNRSEFIQVYQMLTELLTIASAVPVAPPDPNADPSVPAPPQLPGPTAESVLYAQREIDYIVQLWRLPETLTWANISRSVAGQKKKAGGDKGLTVEQAADMLERLVPAMSAQPKPAPPAEVP